nr:MAG TPA: hypothetical protein [Caudoviricetes sp.]
MSTSYATLLSNYSVVKLLYVLGNNSVLNTLPHILG